MTFSPYGEYKDSRLAWLGEVPTHWSVTKTKYVTSFTTGWTPRTEDGSAYVGDNLWANISDLGPRCISDTAKRISDSAVRASRISVSPAGSLLFSFKLSIGAVSFAARNLYTNEAIATFRPSRELCLRYAYYALPLYLVENAAKNIYGAKLLNQELIRSAPLALPPYPEQEAIAAFLDEETAKLDALMVEQRRLIELLKEKRQAVISQAVSKGLNPEAPTKRSGVEWLGEIPAHWEIRTLSSTTVKITNGYVGPTRDILIEEGVRYLQSLHIKENRIRFDVPYFVSEEWSLRHKKSILASGDVLVVQTGDIGQVAVVPEDYAGCNCHALIVVSPRRKVLDGEWLSWCLNSDYGFHTLLSIQTGALHPHLNCGNVKGICIPIPPLDEQRQVAAHIGDELNKLESLSTEAERAIALLLERRTSLISAAVTGKIDVRKSVDTEAVAA